MRRKKRKILIISVISVLVVGIAAMGIVLYKQTRPKPLAKGSTYVSVNTEELETEEAVYTTIPGYADTFTLNNQNRTLPLVNYITNKVTMKFTITENDNVIYETDYLEPGMIGDADLYSLLDSGTHEVNVLIESKLISSDEDGIPTPFDATIVVEK